MSSFYGDYSMRGVIFDSMITTTVTMPAMILLGVMAAYWLRRLYCPAADSMPRSFALLAAMLPLALMLFLWPPGHVSSSKATMIICSYAVYYFVSALVYSLCCQMEDDGRARVFRFFFILLLALTIVSMLLSYGKIGGLLSFIGLVALPAAAVWMVTKAAAKPVWTWTPPPSPDAAETGEAATPTPEPAPALPPISLQKLLLWGLAILGIVWFCAYVASMRPFYAVLVLFWTGVAGFALAQRRTEEEITPSPSPPSQDIG